MWLGPVWNSSIWERDFTALLWSQTTGYQGSCRMQNRGKGNTLWDARFIFVRLKAAGTLFSNGFKSCGLMAVATVGIYCTDIPNTIVSHPKSIVDICKAISQAVCFSPDTLFTLNFFFWSLLLLLLKSIPSHLHPSSIHTTWGFEAVFWFVQGPSHKYLPCCVRLFFYCMLKNLINL